MVLKPSFQFHCCLRNVFERGRASYWICNWILWILFMGVGSLHATDAIDQGWLHLSRYETTEAAQVFAVTESRTLQDERIRRLGEAVGRLHQPALGAAARRVALEALEALWFERKGSVDEVGCWAGYFLGRWQQLYEIPANYDEALSWYRQVYEAGDDNYVAQLARLKATGVELYAPLSNEPNREARIEWALLHLTYVTEPGIRVAYILVLADGLLLHGAPDELVLGYLEEAWSLGVPVPQYRAKTLGQLGTLAHSLGRIDVARNYYEKFLYEFPNDIRTRRIRDQLEELDLIP